MWGPPRFGVVGRPGHRRVFLEEGYQTVQRLRHPYVQLRVCGAWGCGWDLESLNYWVQGFPIRVCPAWARGFLVQGVRDEGDCYWYVVGTC